MNQKTYTAFTLIEIIVAVTMLSLILVSVMSIYISSSDINVKIDITRALQQNVKQTVEMISEDIRKNGYGSGVTSNPINNCSDVASPTQTQRGSRLCTPDHTYYLAKEVGGSYTMVTASSCDDIEEKCTIVRDGEPIMNSWVDVKNVEFLIANAGVKKVTLLLTLQPAISKGIKPALVKDNRFFFQTTISERPNLN